jgi:four helix bundle protein
MKYSRFEEVPVWKTSIDLGIRTYALTKDRAFVHQRSLRDQLERAAISISNNIAEGFERGTTQELLTFLYISRGSSGEVRSMLCLIERLPSFIHLKSLAENVSRQLRGWAESLQDSPVRGQRYLTEKTRRREQAGRSRDEFLRNCDAFRRKSERGEAPL